MSKSQIPSKQEIELLHYQWESLRVNPEYLRDYKKYRKIWTNLKTEYARIWYKMDFYFKRKYGVVPLDPTASLPLKEPVAKGNHSEKQIQEFILWLFFVESQRAVRCLSPEIEQHINDLQPMNIPISSSRRKNYQNNLTDKDLKERISLIFP